MPLSWRGGGVELLGHPGQLRHQFLAGAGDHVAGGETVEQAYP
jgi:hypothetical protein